MGYNNWKEVGWDEESYQKLVDYEEKMAGSGILSTGLPLGMEYPIEAADEAYQRIFDDLRRDYLEHFKISSPSDSGSPTKLQEPDESGQWDFHRKWKTRAKGGKVISVYKHRLTGKYRAVIRQRNISVIAGNHQIRTMELRTNCTFPQAERKAREKLETLLSNDQRHSLYVADFFSETGKSGVVYILRRNRPVIAWSDVRKQFLCALCLHPLAYYKDSWAGILAPSDELIASLLLIRGDEHFFWRKANQIPIDEPNSGI